MSQKFYITNAIPYVNGAPHIGHALEFIQTDVLARYHRALGDDVRYLSGADENSLKNVLAAEKAGVPVGDLVAQNTGTFESLRAALNLSYDDFIRTSDPLRHWPGAVKLWQACADNGDIYKKDYEGLYCVGCEEFKTEKDLIGGLCPEHQTKPELVREANYFFRLSRYQASLEKIIANGEYRVVPDFRANEVLAFIRSGLADFSISRSVARAHDWGIPVPGDPSQILYVWFDALANYITALGYAEDSEAFRHYWPADVHVVGKGITRFHAIYWPAMLLSAKLPLPKTLFVHGYLTVEGQKISKSLGNSIDPAAVAKDYGADALRLYLTKTFSPFDDGDFSFTNLVGSYNSDLANGLGNLVSRIAKLCETSGLEFSSYDPKFLEILTPELRQAIEDFEFNHYLEILWERITAADRLVNQTKPWELLKGESAAEKSRLQEILQQLVTEIRSLALLVEPFIPAGAGKIREQFRGPRIVSAVPVFPRR